MKKIFYFALLNFFFVNSARAVTWEEQSERLQKVSATLLDGVPFTLPVTHNFSLNIEAPLSLLPKTNPTVGAKSEKVPASPVHTIPTIKMSSFVGRSNLFDLGVQAWGGYLMPGVEHVVGIDAKLSQYALGAAISPSKQMGSYNIYITVGGQLSSAKLEGAVTAPGANDKFSADTSLIFIAPGFYNPTKRIWGNIMFGKKTTESRFEIPSDKTVFELSDSLEDAKLPYFIQVSMGINFQNGIKIGLGELWVPNRLLMPRVFLGYSIFER